MRLFLIRHGQSLENLNGTLPPDADPPITELGRRQALYAAHRLLGEGPTLLYGGPLLRNLQTTQPIANATGLTPLIVPALYEAEAHGTAALLAAAVERLPGAQIAPNAAYDYPPNPQTRAEAFARAGELVEWIIATHAANDGQVVAMVSHGMITNMMLCHFLGLPFADYTRFSTGNCAMHILEIAPDRLKVCKLNDESHIPESDRT